MDLYEYQARQLLEEQDIDVPKAGSHRIHMRWPKPPTSSDIRS